MALDAKILKDEQTVLKWDGKKRMLDVWNKDQTTESWMKESVVWFSQVITPRLGQERMENYLQSFSYGNQDMSGGLKTAWLTPEPPLKNTLKISGYEQVKFLEKLWNGTLKASTHSQKVTKSILARETSPNGSLLAGKTGSGRIGPKMDLRIGWWIGYLTYKNDNYIVVVNFNDIEKTQDAHFGGPEARELAKKILTEKDLW
jgi:beta-lactamase class D